MPLPKPTAATPNPTTTLVLASHNAGKLAELRALFAPLALRLVSQSELGLDPAPEPHPTFIENALAKARHAAAATGLPALADDAGLCVHAWGGRPGVHTVDYAASLGLPKGDEHNLRAVLDQLRGQPDRRAALVSTLVALRYPDDPEPLIATGRVEGEIAEQPLGGHGFGFDPVMWLPALGCTFAQLPPEQKNALSHRGQAARHMVQLMRQHWAL